MESKITALVIFIHITYNRNNNSPPSSPCAQMDEGGKTFPRFIDKSYVMHLI